MHLTSSDDRPFLDVSADGAVGCRMRELVTAREGAPTFAMRMFEVDPGGNTPRHSHPWEHEVFVLSGEGLVRLADGLERIRPRDAMLIAPGETHSFVNDGASPLRFLCLIPVEQICCR